MQIGEFIEKIREELPDYTIYIKKDFKYYILYVLKYPTLIKDVYIVTERSLRNKKVAMKRLQTIINDIERG